MLIWIQTSKFSCCGNWFIIILWLIFAFKTFYYFFMLGKSIFLTLLLMWRKHICFSYFTVSLSIDSIFIHRSFWNISYNLSLRIDLASISLIFLEWYCTLPQVLNTTRLKSSSEMTTDLRIFFFLFVYKTSIIRCKFINFYTLWQLTFIIYFIKWFHSSYFCNALPTPNFIW